MTTNPINGKQQISSLLKLSSVLFFAMLMFGNAVFAFNSMAQKLANRRVSLKVYKGQTVLSIIQLIEQESKLKFVYNPDELAEKKAFFSKEYHQHPVRSVLDQLGVYPLEQNDYVILTRTAKTIARLEITGVVKDSLGVTLPGVSVKVIGSEKATLTDNNGNYKINANPGDVLSFSMLGYQVKEVSVANNTTINVVLNEAANLLRDVVIVGYGTQKKQTLTGAISTVSLDQLGSRSLNNVGDVLAGKSPGVIVTNEGGDPTSAPRVNVRGMGGINGESVLYVIDGSIFSGTPQINPNDIEEISVLKDASAAIYGARASGGVVLITTKKGKRGDLQITVDGKVGQQNAWRKLTPLNAEQRAYVAQVAAKNGGSKLLPAFDATLYPDGQITRTNWMDEVFRTGMLQDYSASVSGGGEKSDFYLSFNYRNAEGIVLNTQSQRYNFRINSSHKLNNWLTIGEQLSYSNTNGNGANTSSDYTGALLSAIYYPTNGTPYNADGSFAGLPGPYPGDYGDIINPVAELQRIDINNPINVLVVNPYANVNLAKGLTFRSNFSLTKTNSYYKNFTSKRPEVGKPVLSNNLAERTENIDDLLAEQVLNYKNSFGVHQLDITGGFAYQKRNKRGLYATGSGFDDESKQYRYLVNATIIQPADSYFEAQALSSLFIRANYNYKEKYLLSLIGRRDGTSLLAKDNRFRDYASASAGWVVTKESFLNDVAWLNELKLRGSYGILGGLGGLPITAVNPLLKSTQSYFGQTPTLQTGYVQTVLPNSDIKWAESKQTNFGVDLTIFKNLTLNADYFIKDINKMILTRTLPGTAGLGTQTINAGLVRDRGIELGITYNSKPGTAFQYTINGTLTKLKNEILELVPGIQSSSVGTNFRNEVAPLINSVGQPLYSYYVLKTDGIFQNQAEIDRYVDSKGQKIQPKAKPGDFRFVDFNGDGVIDTKDRYYAGSAYPNFSYGLSFNANYKNFDLNIFAQGVQGNKLFNAIKRTTLNASGQSYNKLTGILDAWSPENPGGKVPIISTSDANGNFNASDFYIEDGSYLRLRNVTIGFTIPQSITSKIKTKGIRVYATANNLFTITNYSGFDPEIGMDNNGLDVGRYPQARSFFVGLSVKL